MLVRVYICSVGRTLPQRTVRRGACPKRFSLYSFGYFIDGDIREIRYIKSQCKTRAKHLHQNLVIETPLYPRELFMRFIQYDWGICVKVVKPKNVLPQKSGGLPQRLLKKDLA